MATMAKAMQAAVEKICRKHVKKETEKLAKQIVSLKEDISKLKGELRDVKKVALSVQGPDIIELSDQDRKKADRMRATGIAVRRLRKKLGISQRELGVLLGVSTQAVYLWERKKTELELRRKARYALYDLKQRDPESIAKRLAN